MTELAEAMDRFVASQIGPADDSLASKAAQIARAAGPGTAATGGLVMAASKAVSALRVKIASAGTGLTLFLTTAGVALAGHAVLPEGLPSVLQTSAAVVSPMMPDVHTGLAAQPGAGSTESQLKNSAPLAMADESSLPANDMGPVTKGLDRAIEAVSAPKPASSQSSSTHARVVSILSLLAGDETPDGHLGALVADLIDPGPKSGEGAIGKGAPVEKGPDPKGPKKKSTESNSSGKPDSAGGKSNRP